MTEIKTESGEVLQTNLPAEKVADLQAQPEQPTPAPKPEAQPASQTNDEQPPQAKTEPEPVQKEQEQPKPPKREKPKPIAKLLEDRHALRTEIEQLKATIEELSSKPTTVATGDDVKALAEELGADPAILQRIVDLARKGTSPELPKEVQDLIAQNKARAEAEAEEQAFKADLTRLEAALKDDQLKQPEVQKKLQELAYSDEKAPDGEPYYKKPLYELYMNYVKPEVEPGKPSAEPARGGSKASGKVLDFAEIASNPELEAEFARTATSEQFKKYHDWQLEHQKEPLRKPGF